MGRRRASSWQDVRNPTSLPLMYTQTQGALAFQLLNEGGSAKVAVIPAAALFAGPCAWVPDARCCAVPLLTVFSNVSLSFACRWWVSYAAAQPCAGWWGCGGHGVGR